MYKLAPITKEPSRSRRALFANHLFGFVYGEAFLTKAAMSASSSLFDGWTMIASTTKRRRELTQRLHGCISGVRRKIPRSISSCSMRNNQTIPIPPSPSLVPPLSRTGIEFLKARLTRSIHSKSASRSLRGLPSTTHPTQCLGQLPLSLSAIRELQGLFLSTRKQAS